MQCTALLGLQIDIAAAELSDEAIAALLQQHLQLQPDLYLSAAQQPRPNTTASSSNGKPPARSKAASGKAAAAGSSVRYKSVDAFVAQMSRLLDMERQAEVAAAQEAATQCSTAAAQVKGAAFPMLSVMCCCARAAGMGETGLQSAAL